MTNNPLAGTDPDGHGPKKGPIELGRGASMRVDTMSHDQVNVHVYDGNGKDWRGRLDPDTKTIQWEKGTPPKRLAEKAQDYVLSRGKYDIAKAKQEMSIMGEDGEEAGKPEDIGTLSLSILTLLDIGAQSAEMAQINKLEPSTGFHFDHFGTMIVTNLTHFGETMGVGAQVEAKGDTFTLQKDGSWTDKAGDQLTEDSDGSFEIKGPEA